MAERKDSSANEFFPRLHSVAASSEGCAFSGQGGLLEAPNEELLHILRYATSSAHFNLISAMNCIRRPIFLALLHLSSLIFVDGRYIIHDTVRRLSLL